MELNINDVIQLILALIGLASVIVRLTPNTKDDEVLGKIKGFVSKFLALNPEKTVEIKVK